MKAQEIAIFPLPHTLKFIEQAALVEYTTTNVKVTPEQELNILKGILIINSEANEKIVSVFKGIDLSNIESIYKIFWSSLLPNSTVLLKKDLIISLYKSLKFLGFLNTKYPEYLKKYLEANKLDVYQRLPLNLFSLYSEGYNKEGDSFFSFFNKTLIEHYPVVNNLTLDIANFSREEYLEKKFDKNFKGLRTFPFLKVKEEYNLTNWNFIIEKFYEGLVFDFYAKSNIREIKELKCFEDYKNKMGDYYANVFFMDLMKDMFSHFPIICLREKERNEDCDYDFYIRIKNHVFFFEFKDVLFPINETYEDIKNTIDTKLGSNKGVKQIIRQIKNFEKDHTIYDDFEKEGISKEQIIIYPILVYTDNAFGMTGVNHYLNTLFTDELSKELSQRDFTVQPLALISFDFLLEEHKNFKDGKFDLVQVLNSYYNLHNELTKEYKQNPKPQTLQNAFDGFDVIIRQIITSYSADQLGSYFYEWILAEFKPFLAKD